MNAKYLFSSRKLITAANYFVSFPSHHSNIKQRESNLLIECYVLGRYLVSCTDVHVRMYVWWQTNYGAKQRFRTWVFPSVARPSINPMNSTIPSSTAFAYSIWIHYSKSGLGNQSVLNPFLYFFPYVGRCAYLYLLQLNFKFPRSRQTCAAAPPPTVADTEEIEPALVRHSRSSLSTIRV